MVSYGYPEMGRQFASFGVAAARRLGNPTPFSVPLLPTTLAFFCPHPVIESHVPLRCFYIAVLLVTSLVGCAPQPLSEPLDSGTEQTDTGPDDTSEPPEFGVIANVIRQNCAISSGCHAGEGHRGFGVPGGSMADDSTVADTLQQAEIGDSNDPLVVPGNAEQSALYQVLIGDGRPEMPQSGPLDESTIETVRLWIAAGADYGE